MKSKLITMSFLLLLLVVSDASAQTRIGIKGGVNFGNLHRTINPDAWIPEDAELTTGNGIVKSGLVAGIVAEFFYTGKLSFQTEFQYIRKGGRFLNTVQGETISRSTTINNIDIPVLLKYNFTINEKLTAFATAGINIGFLHSAEREICLDGDCDTNGLLFIPEYEDYDDLEMNRGDIGISIGTGIIFKDHLFFDLRYVSGSANIWRQGTYSVTNNGFQIGLGTFF